MKNSIHEYLEWITKQNLEKHGVSRVVLKLPSDAFEFTDGSQWLDMEKAKEHIKNSPGWATRHQCLRMDLKCQGKSEIRFDMSYRRGSLGMHHDDGRGGFFEGFVSLEELPSWTELRDGDSQTK